MSKAGPAKRARAARLWPRAGVSAALAHLPLTPGLLPVIERAARLVAGV